MINSNSSTSPDDPCYVLDERLGVYTRPGTRGIGYRDGGEDKLIRLIQAVDDRSTFSSELVRHMVDWPSEYHFSRKRHLVLRPFDIKRGDRVLELGSGCGSITRYLAEIGAEVTSVEAELSRAAIAAKRCEGFKNVRVVVDNFLSLNIAEKYDWVLMIGVLEYSQKYASSGNRQREYLDLARRYMKPNGNLLVAIENKLGIKYFNGAGEDHNGKRFYGPQDLYSDNDITTWGRAELAEMLADAGFFNCKFFAAFPDYKLPKVIYSENISMNRSFRAEEMMHYSRSLDYRGMNDRVFDESLVLGSLRKNGLMIDMANSFLIACRYDEKQDGYDPSILAHYFSVDRKRDLCTHTCFVTDAHSQIKVLKSSLFPDGAVSDRPILVTTESGDLIQIRQIIDNGSSKYFPGRLMGVEISKALKKSDGDRLVSLLETWTAFLLHSFKINCRLSGNQLPQTNLRGRRMGSITIEGSALDCGPQNIVLGETIHAFDLEWQADRPVPLSWVLNRNAKHIIRARHFSKPTIQASEIVAVIANILGLELTPDDIVEANNLEKQFQSGVALVEPSNLTPLREPPGLS